MARFLRLLLYQLYWRFLFDVVGGDGDDGGGDVEAPYVEESLVLLPSSIHKTCHCYNALAIWVVFVLGGAVFCGYSSSVRREPLLLSALLFY